MPGRSPRAALAVRRLGIAARRLGSGLWMVASLVLPATIAFLPPDLRSVFPVAPCSPWPVFSVARGVTLVNG